MTRTITPIEDANASGHVRALTAALDLERERVDLLEREKNAAVKRADKIETGLWLFMRKHNDERIRAERAEAELDALRRIARGEEVQA